GAHSSGSVGSSQNAPAPGRSKPRNARRRPDAGRSAKRASVARVAASGVTAAAARGAPAPPRPAPAGAAGTNGPRFWCSATPTVVLGVPAFARGEAPSRLEVAATRPRGWLPAGAAAATDPEPALWFKGTDQGLSRGAPGSFGSPALLTAAAGTPALS